MPLVQSRPITPTQRFLVSNKRTILDKKRPEKSLTKIKRRSGGRNNNGRMTTRRRGGGHKKLYRKIDFHRRRFDETAKVIALEYDPNRSANIALIQYDDGQKSYIIAPRDLRVGATIVSTQKVADFDIGNRMPLRVVPPATRVHAVEVRPGSGARIARAAGLAVQLMAIEGNRATVRLPSGEIRYLSADCLATIGEVGNREHENRSLAKAGRNRWLGKRPRVRGVAMNPVDHPMGGGEGRTSGGGHPVSPWGQLAKGFPTRRKKKASNRQILIRRNGRKMKR